MFSQRTSTVKLAMLVLSTLSFAIPSHAQSIVDSIGVKILSTPPASVYNNAQVNVNKIIGFQEDFNYILTEDQKVDIKPNGNPGTIKAGTAVTSYFFSADPGVNKTRNYGGYITFSSKILGIIVTKPKLDATDSVFGSPDTLYPSTAPADTNRGLEASSNSFDNIGKDLNTVFFILHVNGAMDQFRVLVAVPETSQTASFGIGALGLFGLIAMARKRRQIV